MKIRKNTKEHSAIFEVLKKYESDKNRNKLIKLFTLKAGENIKERKPVEDAKAFADLYYNLNYNSILNNLLDKDHQLNKSDEEEDLYFFESSYADYETPFQLSEEVTQEIITLLKNKKFKARAPKSLEEDREQIPVENPSETKKEAELEVKGEQPQPPHLKIVKDDEEKTEEIIDNGEESEEELEEEKAEEPQVVKESQDQLARKVLDEYFDQVMELILPWTKDRPLFESDIEELLPSNVDHPDWMKTINYYVEDGGGEYVLGQNREHIQYLVKNGLTELRAWTSRNKNLKAPDFLVINLIANEVPFEQLVATVRETHEVLEICEIEGFVISTGADSFSILIPIDGKSDFEVVQKLGDLISKLITRKTPGLSTLSTEEKKKTLVTSGNQIGRTFIVPFSINKETERVCVPVLWENLDQLDIKFNTMEQILKNHDKNYLTFVNLTKNKLNAKEVFDKLDRRYGFLL